MARTSFSMENAEILCYWEKKTQWIGCKKEDTCTLEKSKHASSIVTNNEKKPRLKQKKVKSECIDLFPSNDNPQAHSENEKEKNSIHKPTMKWSVLKKQMWPVSCWIAEYYRTKSQTSNIQYTIQKVVHMEWMAMRLKLPKHITDPFFTFEITW